MAANVAMDTVSLVIAGLSLLLTFLWYSWNVWAKHSEWNAEKARKKEEDEEEKRRLNLEILHLQQRYHRLDRIIGLARGEAKSFTLEKYIAARDHTTRRLRDAQAPIDVEAVKAEIMGDLSVSLGEISAKVDKYLEEAQRRDEAAQAQISALESTISSIKPCKCETGKAPEETPVSGKASPRSEASSSQDLRRIVSARQMEKKKPWNPNFQRG
ncbi:hypothetical protein N0V84_009737 [Fusarium piperis]|uniref:Uncharacterized protein n=1 Tax=Fusarium piperis TaxID=1435070 RepID=A0A9W9BJM8_9HYPO|nr:hypothetical protein N0V84_009737 [Fusarium piperis]